MGKRQMIVSRGHLLSVVCNAIYRAGGADSGEPVDVLPSMPDRIGDFGETRIVAETVIIDVRVSQVAALTRRHV